MPIVSSRSGDVTAGVLPETLWRAARDPVAFRETMAMLERHGSPTYIDCGPSGTLATFVKYNLPKDAHHRIVSVITPFGRNVERVDALARSMTTGEPV
jgi:bacillaene synthase trans-acting acyltransferase